MPADHMDVSVALAVARISEIQAAFRPPVAPTTAPAGIDSGDRAGGSSFASTLAAASATTPSTGAPTGSGAALAAAARAEVGQREQPMGSNDSARIAQYRSAVLGAGVGPWCAYFASWAAAQAGIPLGDRGQGFARVDDVWAWGQRTGRTLPAGSTPQPGDLIIWDEHMGVVESVLPDGSIQTVEGNSSDQVSRRIHRSDGDGAIGFVRPGPAR